MWDVFPIQCQGDKGSPLKTIIPNYKYTVYDEVNVKPWKEVPDEVKRWCMTIWNDEFNCIRCPAGGDDLLFWIPKQGMLLGKKGIWVDELKSKRVVYVSCNYVHPEMRKQRVSERLIHMVGHKANELWNIDSFIFEAAKFPRTLLKRNAIPIAKFQYTWVPTMMIDKEWKEITNNEIKNYIYGKEGFYPDECVGCIGFQHSKSKNIIVLDYNDDVVAYDSYLDLTTLNGKGHYCRVFSELGMFYFFAENMYFERTNSFKIIP